MDAPGDTERDTMTDTRQTIRQGDIALIPTTHAAPVKGPVSLLALAIGEDSGHAHSIIGKRMGDLLTVVESTPLVIEPAPLAWRHAPIDVPAGDYRVVIQREYTPEGARQVQD